jgi:hypothetical protein
MKIHHTAIDGQEGIQLVNVLTSVDPEASVRADALELVSAAATLFVEPLAAQPVRTPVPTDCRSELGAAGCSRAGADGHRDGHLRCRKALCAGSLHPVLSDAVTFDFADVKKIRQRVGCDGQ